MKSSIGNRIAKQGVCMSFCKFSSEFIRSSHVELSNDFIKEFLPSAPDCCVKVYLYGLYLCSENLDYSIEDMAANLHESVEDIESAFLYWQELGLVQVLSTTPIEVRYLPTKFGSHSYKKYNKEKYSSFNIELQEILNGRQITPNEYNEYYYFMETYGFTQTALLMIARYCVSLKNNKINYPYISKVIRDFINDNIFDEKGVEERLAEQERATSDLKLVLKALKISHKPTLEEYNMYLDWTKDMEMELSTILAVAKHIKSGGMSKLNSLLEKCYNARCNTANEVKTFFDNQEKYIDIAKTICKNLGVRYESLDNIIEKYIVTWSNMGYDKDTLVELADYCFLKSIRTLEGLNMLVQKFYNLGLVSLDSIHKYIDEQNAIDSKIKSILESLGISRFVTSDDRTKYNLWQEWAISDELLDYAIQKASGKVSAMIYLHKILSSFHSNNITTVEQAKKQNISFDTPKTNTSTMPMRTYKKEELASLFDDIKKVEL